MLFSEGKETFYLKLFSGIQLISYLKSAYHYIAVLSDKAPMSSKRILNVDLSYLSKCTEFF